MSNMAVGIPIGFAIGIGSGVPIGKEQAEHEIRKKIIEYAASHMVIITDSAGVAVQLEQFTADLCGMEQTKPAWLRTAIIVGLSLFFIVAIVAYFIVTG